MVTECFRSPPLMMGTAGETEGLPLAGEADATFPVLEEGPEPTTTAGGWEPDETIVLGPEPGFLGALAAEA